jgi:hypothetical protein
MKIGELLVQLGFKSDDAKLKDFVKAIGELNLKSVASVLGVGALYDGIRRVMNVADETAMGMHHFSSETGMSAQKMQQWTNFANQMGVSADTVIGSVKSLQDNVSRMRLTGEGSQGWMLLGIDPNTAKDSFDLLSKVREAVKGLSPEYQRLAMQQIGLSDSMLSMMKVSDDLWNSSGKLITNSDQQTESLMRNHAAWERLKGEWRVLLTDLGAAMAPLFEKIAGAIDWVVRAAHKLPWVQQIIVALAAAIGVVTVALGGMTVALAAAAIWGWISGLNAVVLVIGAIAAGIALIVQNWEKLRGFISGIGKGAAGFLNQINPFGSELSFMGLSPVAEPGASSVGGSSSKVVQNRPIFNITGNNPEEIANKVNEKLQRMLSDAEYQTRE